ncbi:hypothetical protein BOTBODRAFT_409660 [Botryobasidium botryosum FD-172 SS1]|uniref:Uncharacterized protein n=1 Tax=Botryobasidium botryosum (strain FD-172 SS1) TaxID=930990 RepID=A0A067MLJ1_BOTB1|nr:hypothetical protein BOTBODRAFT_409660 [Botryobasidium botryosum FD-172 SS1]
MPKSQSVKKASASGSKKSNGKGKSNTSKDQARLQPCDALPPSAIAQTGLKRERDEAGEENLPDRKHLRLGAVWPHLLTFNNNTMYIWPCKNFAQSLPPNAPGYVATLVGHEDTTPRDLELL